MWFSLSIANGWDKEALKFDFQTNYFPIRIWMCYLKKLFKVFKVFPASLSSSTLQSSVLFNPVALWNHAGKAGQLWISRHMVIKTLLSSWLVHVLARKAFSFKTSIFLKDYFFFFKNRLEKEIGSSNVWGVCHFWEIYWECLTEEAGMTSSDVDTYSEDIRFS